MQAEVIDNASQDLASVLTSAMERSQSIKIAVAFVTIRGFKMIESSVLNSLRVGAYAEFLVGMDLATTEPKALWHLYELAQHQRNVSLYCYADLGPSVVYHPKLYMMH